MNRNERTRLANIKAAKKGKNPDKEEVLVKPKVSKKKAKAK